MEGNFVFALPSIPETREEHSIQVGIPEFSLDECTQSFMTGSGQYGAVSRVEHNSKLAEPEHLNIRRHTVRIMIVVLSTWKYC